MSDARIQAARAELNRAGIAFAAVEPRTWRLCYAWFTTQLLGKQWGDDWNDAPYEHNAGEPYQWTERTGGEPWHLLQVGWTGSAETPAGYGLSVEQINCGARAWLVAYGSASVRAGASFEEFVAFIRVVRGEVFLPMATP